MEVDHVPIQGSSLLRQTRRAKHLTLRQVAEQANVDFVHLSRVERGERQFSVDALYRVARVLDLSDLANNLAPFCPSERSA